MLALAILSGIAVVSYLGYWAVGAALAWLGDQPAYQVPFRSIVLDPPPPHWYRGGSAAFLQSVRRRARIPEKIPVLKLKEEELKNVFLQCSPWTEQVFKITYRPFGLTVRLNYHRPVAIVATSTGKKYLVDGSAIILPLEDVDQQQLEQDRGLITIKGDDLSDPLDPQPGITWKPKAGLSDVAPGNDGIPAAAKLASFLAEKMRSLDQARNPALNFTHINPMDRDSRGLFLWNSEKTYVLWGEAPGEEKSGSLGAEKKWEKLCEWSRTERKRIVPKGDFWQITAAGVSHINSKPPAPGSAQVIRPLRDGSGIRTHRSGQSAESVSHSG
jgi:hypothetical protein